MSRNRRLFLAVVRLLALCFFVAFTLSYAIHGGGRTLVIVPLVCLLVLIVVPAPPPD